MKHENLLLKSALALAIVDLVLIAAILLQVNNLVKDVLEVQNRQLEIGVMEEKLEKAEEIKTPEVKAEKKEEETKFPEELKNIQFLYKKWRQEIIYKSNIDGTDEYDLIQDPISLVISPDKQKIAYTPSGGTQIQMITLVDQKIKTLINLQKNNQRVGGLLWGTDGQTIVYRVTEFEDRGKTELGEPPKELPKIIMSQTRMVSLDGADKLIRKQALNYIVYLSDKSELWSITKPKIDEVTGFGEISIINTKTNQERVITFGNLDWTISYPWQYASDYSKIYFSAKNTTEDKTMLVEYNILNNSYKITASTAEETARILLSPNRQYQIYTHQISKQTERREQELEIWITDLISKENKKIGNESGINTNLLFWVNNNWMLFLHREAKKSSDIFGGKEGPDQYYLLSVSGEKIILRNFEQDLNFIDWVSK